MSATTYDIAKIAQELSVALATRCRHVCLLLGAGASVGSGLPDMRALTAKVLESLSRTDKDLTVELLKDRSLEQVLTRLRRIAAIVDDGEKIGGINKATSARLDAAICETIIGSIRHPTRQDDFTRLGSWANRAEYHRPLELFTTNYDLLIEAGLEAVGAAYFDGFTGYLRGYFRPDLVEPPSTTSSSGVPAQFIRLWKLHGSSNWVWEGTDRSRRIVRLGDHALAGKTVAIYPSDQKYDDSRRVPFVVIMDRFRRALSEPETLLLIAGYSFSDEHLNEVIFEAARRRPRSQFVAMCYSSIPIALKKSALETRNIVAIGATEAIISGKAGSWAIDNDIPGLIRDRRCCLGSFSYLAAFLDNQGHSQDDAITCPDGPVRAT